ncbi:hypothetical protein EB796_006353 [Bugula neritina]|uniref:Uncharacterized protein n=1 Tax=Bugula neritina TaxID=10212 RepID=A0A7J7KCK6_BUGNE|nr:hypothetical protein EB796_006353 [Bugula neritina]
MLQNDSCVFLFLAVCGVLCANLWVKYKRLIQKCGEMEREKDLMMMENEELRNKLCCAEREMGLLKGEIMEKGDSLAKANSEISEAILAHQMEKMKWQEARKQDERQLTRNKIELAIGKNYVKEIKKEHKGLKAQVDYLQQVKVCLFLLTLLFGL